MKSIFLVLSLAMALPAFADALDQAVFRLIPPGAQTAVGIYTAQFESSPMSRLFFLPLDVSGLDHYVRVEKNTDTEYWVFEIYTGSFEPLQATSTNAEQGQEYRGVPLAELSWGLAAQITSEIRILGYPAQIHAAIDQWLDAVPPAGVAQSAARAAMSFDDWMVIDRPVNLLRDLGATDQLPQFAIGALERISEAIGGMRTGPSIDLFAELSTERPADAAAIAALGSVLPGLLKTLSGDSLLGSLVDIAEGFEVHASGQNVLSSARLPAEKVNEIADELDRPPAVP